MNSHLERAFWLTTMVESGGMAGGVMMADGTGCTASLEQLVAVYPRHLSKQGPLFKMLRRLNYVLPINYYLPFDEYGWFLGHDGVLRCRDTGKEIHPRVIRDTFTPNNGKVPAKGSDWEASKEWAIGFNRLFSLIWGIPVQITYGQEQFVKFAKRFRSSKLGGNTVEELAYYGEFEDPNPFDFNPINDLAMALWWCYKVNAPSPAMTILRNVAKNNDPHDGLFGRTIIKKLRTSKYGRWATNRYDRSRRYARKVWPKELFVGDKAVMPPRKRK
jgi:hypothetical protein